MTDIEKLKALQDELIKTLEDRRKRALAEKIPVYPRECSLAKINRLRLQAQEIMLRIERNCSGCTYKEEQEYWRGRHSPS